MNLMGATLHDKNFKIRTLKESSTLVLKLQFQHLRKQFQIFSMMP